MEAKEAKECKYFNITQPRNIFDLPAEDFFVNHLAKYLTLQDLFILRCCSRKCKDLVDKIMAGRKVVTVCSWQISRDIDEVLPTLHVLAESCKNIQKIHLIDIWWMKDELLQRFLANNTNLEVIDLLGCGDITEKGFQAISKDCPKLKSLMVENTRFSNAGLDAFRLHNNNLIEVNFSQCNFSTTCLNAFFASQPHLRTILLCGMSRYNDIKSILRTIATSCRNLENLDVRWNEKIDDEDVLNIAEKCSKIKYLFTSRNNLSEHTIQYLRDRKIGVIFTGNSYEKHPFYLAGVLEHF